VARSAWWAGNAIHHTDVGGIDEGSFCVKPALLLIRGLDDPSNPPDYEQELHEAVPGSRYIRLRNAGHFPVAERPESASPPAPVR
jgi:pimeloyl-ACP methyl ester carboxylesterase